MQSSKPSSSTTQHFSGDPAIPITRAPGDLRDLTGEPTGPLPWTPPRLAGLGFTDVLPRPTYAVSPVMPEHAQRLFVGDTSGMAGTAGEHGAGLPAGHPNPAARRESVICGDSIRFAGAALRIVALAIFGR